MQRSPGRSPAPWGFFCFRGGFFPAVNVTPRPLGSRQRVVADMHAKEFRHHHRASKARIQGYIRLGKAHLGIPAAKMGTLFKRMTGSFEAQRDSYAEL